MMMGQAVNTISHDSDPPDERLWADGVLASSSVYALKMKVE